MMDNKEIVEQLSNYFVSLFAEKKQIVVLQEK